MVLQPYVDRRRLDQLAHEGRATFVGAHWDSSSSEVGALVAPTAGQVAIVTRIVGNPSANASSLLTPAPAAQLSLISPGAAVTEALKVQIFNRHPGFGAAQELRSPPDTRFDWSPSSGLVVPSGWTLYSFTDSTQGQGFSAYGYLISEGDARELGYDVTTTALQTGRRWIQTGLAATNGTQTLIAARTGMAIQILDIYARLQPIDGGTTAKMTLQQTDGDTIMDFINQSRANLSEWKMSPGIYLEPGVGLRLIGNAGSGGRGSVIVIARYVDSADVPGNVWWSYKVPALPTPAGFTPDAAGFTRAQNTRMTAFYPKSNTTKNEAGKGYNHIVEGYSVSGAKTNASPSDLINYALIVNSTTPQTQTLGVNGLVAVSAYQITHTIGFGGVDMTSNAYIDQVNIPVPQDQAVWFTALNVDLGGAFASDADISQWSCTVWGRTVASTRKADNFDHYTGDRT